MIFYYLCIMHLFRCFLSILFFFSLVLASWQRARSSSVVVRAANRNKKRLFLVLDRVIPISNIYPASVRLMNNGLIAICQDTEEISEGVYVMICLKLHMSLQTALLRKPTGYNRCWPGVSLHCRRNLFQNSDALLSLSRFVPNVQMATFSIHWSVVKTLDSKIGNGNQIVTAAGSIWTVVVGRGFDPATLTIRCWCERLTRCQSSAPPGHIFNDVVYA